MRQHHASARVASVNNSGCQTVKQQSSLFDRALASITPPRASRSERRESMSPLQCSGQNLVQSIRNSVHASGSRKSLLSSIHSRSRMDHNRRKWGNATSGMSSITSVTPKRPTKVKQNGSLKKNSPKKKKCNHENGSPKPPINIDNNCHDSGTRQTRENG
jgi:hypothetical protein